MRACRGLISVSTALKLSVLKTLTRVGELSDVIAGIDAAGAAQFKRIKLNAVILAGFNDDEVIDLARLLLIKEWIFLLLRRCLWAKFPPIIGSTRRLPVAHIREQLESEFTLSDSAETTGGPSRYARGR